MKLLELQQQLEEMKRRGAHDNTQVEIRADTRADDAPSRFDSYGMRPIRDVWYHPDADAVIIDEEEK